MNEQTKRREIQAKQLDDWFDVVQLTTLLDARGYSVRVRPLGAGCRHRWLVVWF